VQTDHEGCFSWPVFLKNTTNSKYAKDGLMIMNEDPVQFDNGELGCPGCKAPLTEGKSPFHYRGIMLGSFDSLRCDFCGYFVLTESGFVESSKAITRQEST